MKNFFLKTSAISKFYQKTIITRQAIIKKFSNLTNEDIDYLNYKKFLDLNIANKMIENVIGIMPIPLGIATNFKINKKDYLIPMAIEEPSVIAAASNGAKLARKSGGFSTSSTKPIMFSQIQIKNIKNFKSAITNIKNHNKELLQLANSQDPLLCSLGGGAKKIKIKQISTVRGEMLIVHLIVNVKDAMGANIVNNMAEKIAPELEKLTGGNIILRIVSNLSIYRIVKAKAIWKEKILGKNIIENILDAQELALTDYSRCATHNKGIMNGIDAVATATGNDWRAIEAGAHAYAALNNNYKPLSKYYKNKTGDLVGEIKLPLACGIVGGITQIHPIAKICLKILKIKKAEELAQIMAAVGLAQNFAALKALVTEGIQKGHMKLHSKNIAMAAGAQKDLIDRISNQMCKENKISTNYSKELIKKYAIKREKRTNKK